jgi:HTH-type transcriptional regulator, sugar sensing transcriptional regulator
MYETTLTQAGLSQEQAQIYEILLKNGPSTARKIAQNSPYKRTLVYKILEDLGKIGLVTRQDEVGKVSIFSPSHPVKLKELAEKKQQQAKQAETALENILGTLVSNYNLFSGKPGVQFYEGVEGVNKITADSLTAKGVIYSYVDNEAVNKYVPKINEEYKKKREHLGIKKKMITVDGPYIREKVKTYNPAVSEVRVIPSTYPFVSVMQIYDNKISYLTLDEKNMIGIIIDDPHLAKMHKTLFEYTWSVAMPLLAGSSATVSDGTTDNTSPVRDNSATPR